MLFITQELTILKSFYGFKDEVEKKGHWWYFIQVELQKQNIQHLFKTIHYIEEV